MSTQRLLSLPTAILININIMLGTGIFINTVELSKRAGVYGSFLYLLMGIFVLPLILSMAALMKLHPSGGFYGFGRAEISPLAGFISAWSYFSGKLASSMLMIHVSVSLLQCIIPVLNGVNIFILDVVVLALFLVLNMLNIRTGSYIQMGFLGLKLFPILFVIITGTWFFSGAHIMAGALPDIVASFPLVLYGALGFEATCSLSSRIKDAERNGPKAIYYSFGIAILLVFLFQFLFYAMLGQQLVQAGSYLNAFPTLLVHLLGTHAWTPYLTTALHIAIASSALGGSYGILYSNSWNLYTLAQQGYVWGSSWFSTLSSMGIPLYCVLVEGIICLAFLTATSGAQVPLQQVSALSSVVAYTISVLALLCAVYKRNTISISRAIPVLGLISCSILLSATIRSFFIAGMFSLVLFIALGLLGITMFFTSCHRKSENI